MRVEVSPRHLTTNSKDCRNDKPRIEVCSPSEVQGDLFSEVVSYSLVRLALKRKELPPPRTFFVQFRVVVRVERLYNIITLLSELLVNESVGQAADQLYLVDLSE